MQLIIELCLWIQSLLYKVLEFVALNFGNFIYIRLVDNAFGGTSFFSMLVCRRLAGIESVVVNFGLPIWQGTTSRDLLISFLVVMYSAPEFTEWRSYIGFLKCCMHTLLDGWLIPIFISRHRHCGGDMIWWSCYTNPLVPPRGVPLLTTECSHIITKNVLTHSDPLPVSR